MTAAAKRQPRPIRLADQRRTLQPEPVDVMMQGRFLLCRGGMRWTTSGKRVKGLM